MTFSLRQRILLTVTPLLLLIGTLGGWGAILISQLGQRSDAILRENYDSVQAMVRMNEALERIDSSFQFALAGKEEAARTGYRDNWAKFREQLGIEERNITIFPDEPQLVAELQAATVRYQLEGDRFFAMAPTLKEARSAIYFGTGESGLLATFQSLKRISTSIRDLNEAQMQSAAVAARETARDSVVGFVIGLIAAVILAIIAIWWLQRTILGPIRAVTEATQRIGGGELHLMVPSVGSDEIAQLAQAFNSMTQRLREYRLSNTERLLRARQTSQATIDSFPDPVIVIDLLGRVEIANAAAQRVLGVMPALDGHAPQVWQAPDTLRTPITAALQHQRPFLTTSFDQAITFRLDGDDHAYLPQIRPIRSDSNETLGAAVVLDDVTRFRLLDRLKSDWVATVSHELKTPLTSVRLAVHVLLEEVVGTLEPKQIELLLEARDNTERLLKLIEHLLSLARLEEGGDRLVRQSIEPGVLLRTAMEAAASRAEDKHITIRYDESENLPMIQADPVRMGHALNNLLDNALTYTPIGGQVILSAKIADSEHVELMIHDTGIGIPAESLPHVFERFFRVPDRDQTPGTGLGLAIVHEIITAHQGQITCTSEAGHGTTFVITLPTEKLS